MKKLLLFLFMTVMSCSVASAACMLPGDTNNDNIVTIAEVQKTINAFLGLNSCTLPPVPSGLSATVASNTQVNLSWTTVANSSVAGYKVYRDNMLIGSSIISAFADLGPTAGTSYSYTVAAYDINGNESSRSTAVSTPTSGSIIGIWRTTNGTAFTYLSLFSDNTFVFADRDLTATGDLEVGTYTYNGTNITFNIAYDRNSNGRDSGIGVIGTPSVISSVLSNNNNTLTIADGGRVLNRATFNTAPIVNVWRKINGAGFSYLILFGDNTFMYAENDLTVTSAAENGLEAGTYVYNGTNLTFNITYDDNAPGHDSGVGDIGTPAVFNATVSADGKTLTAAGGELVLTKVF